MTEQSYCSFVVGQKITLKGPLRAVVGRNEVIPAFGIIYTVRSLVETLTGIGVLLTELVNKPQQYAEGLVECSFIPENFRPVTTTSTDAGMAILRKIDADVFQNERVSA